MDRQAKIDLCNRALHGAVNSALQYMENSTPYVPVGAEEQWDAVLAARDEEAAVAREFHAVVGELDGVAKVGVFPYWNVDLNYLDLKWFCRFANRHNRSEIEWTEQVLPDVRADAKLHRLFTGLLEMRRKQEELLASVGGEESQEESTEEAPAAAEGSASADE